MKEFIFKEIRSEESNIHICSYADFDPMLHLENLTPKEKEKMFSFRSATRKMEFVAARILRNRIFGLRDVLYLPDGSPYIEDDRHISISHSKNVAALAVNRSHKIGLDIEIPRDKILNLTDKFLSDQEKYNFDITDAKEVTKLWSVKEAFYKLADRKKIHFKTELQIEKDRNGNWQGKIVNSDHDLLVKINIFELNDLIICINAKELVKKHRNI